MIEINKTITSFFDTYNSIIDTKLNNDDYILLYDGITIKINDNIDIKLLPNAYLWNGEAKFQLFVTIYRYNNPVEYNRRFNICGTYKTGSSGDKNEYGLFSLYYSKCLELYSKLILPKLTDILIDISSDIRNEKINNLLDD